MTSPASFLFCCVMVNIQVFSHQQRRLVSTHTLLFITGFRSHLTPFSSDTAAAAVRRPLLSSKASLGASVLHHASLQHPKPVIFLAQAMLLPTGKKRESCAASPLFYVSRIVVFAPHNRHFLQTSRFPARFSANISLLAPSIFPHALCQLPRRCRDIASG